MSDGLRNIGSIVAGVVGFVIGGSLGNAKLGFAIGTLLFNFFVPPKAPAAPSSGVGNEGSKYTAVGTGLWQVFGRYERETGDLIRCAKNSKGERSGIIVKKKDAEQVGGSGGMGQGQAQAPAEERSFLSASFALCEGFTYIDRMTELNGKVGEKVRFDRSSTLDSSLAAKIATLDQQIAAENNLIRRSFLIKQRAELVKQQGKTKGIVFTPVYGAVSGELVAELSEKVRFYYGSEEQPVDSIEASWYSDGVSADRGITKVVFNMYGPLESGTTFRFLLRNALTGHREIITYQLKRAGIPESRIHLDSIPADASNYGWYVEQREEARILAEQVAAFTFHDLHFLSRDVGAVFTDISRANPTVITIEDDEMGAFVNTDGRGQAVSSSAINLTGPEKKPRELKTNFINKDKNFKTESVVAQWLTANGEPQEVTLRAVGTPQDFEVFNEAAMREIQAAGGGTTISLMPKFARVAPGCVLDVPERTEIEPNGRRYLRVVQQSHAPEGVLLNTCVPHDVAAYNIIPSSPTTTLPPPTVELLGTPELVFLDGVSLSNSMAQQPTLLAVPTVATGTSFDGATLRFHKAAFDFGHSHTHIRPTTPFADIEFRSLGTVGLSETAYEYSDADLYGFEYSKTLRVTFDHGQLVSADQAAVRNGANVLWWGGMYLAFTTATQIDSNTFDITGLLPGLYGSDYVRNIPTGARVVKISDENGLQDAAVVAVPIQSRWLNQTIEYDLYRLGGSRREAPEEGELICAGNNMKPLAVSPFIVKGKDADVEDGYGYYLKFFARTRFTEEDANYYQTGFPVEWSDPLTFKVRLLNGATVVNERIINATDGEVTVHYTNAELVAYFGALPLTLSGTIQQNSTRYEGFVRAFTNI